MSKLQILWQKHFLCKQKTKEINDDRRFNITINNFRKKYNPFKKRLFKKLKEYLKT